MTIGQQIKYWRKKRKMTMSELAEKAGIANKQGVNDYESGRINPSTPMLSKIAEALGCEVEILLQEKKQR